MEKRSSKNAMIIGILLVLFGVLSLLQNLGMAGFVGVLVWGAAFGAGGAIFLYFFLKHDAYWWASIPAGALLGIAMTIGAEKLLPWLPDGIVGSIFLAMLGLGFLAIVLMNRAGGRSFLVVRCSVLLRPQRSPMYYPKQRSAVCCSSVWRRPLRSWRSCARPLPCAGCSFRQRCLA
jgi:hypothetical protein